METDAIDPDALPVGRPWEELDDVRAERDELRATLAREQHRCSLLARENEFLRERVAAAFRVCLWGRSTRRTEDRP